jgi:hypothetical protein
MELVTQEFDEKNMVVEERSCVIFLVLAAGKAHVSKTQME